MASGQWPEKKSGSKPGLIVELLEDEYRVRKGLLSASRVAEGDGSGRWSVASGQQKKGGSKREWIVELREGEKHACEGLLGIDRVAKGDGLG